MNKQIREQTWVQTGLDKWESVHWPTDLLPIYLPQPVLEELLILLTKNAADSRGLLVCVGLDEWRQRLTMAGIWCDLMPRVVSDAA